MSAIRLNNLVTNRQAPPAGRTEIFSKIGPPSELFIVDEFNNVSKIATSSLPQSFLSNFSVAAQSLPATTRTYIVGSTISVPVGKLRIGSMFQWTFDMTKTAAGIAASTIDMAVGTAGTTADTARISFTKPAGTAVIDTGLVVVTAVVRGPLSASGVMVGTMAITHNLAATGHALVPCVNVTTISGAFDVTVANLKIGLCITTGTADAITIQQVIAESWNL